MTSQNQTCCKLTCYLGTDGMVRKWVRQFNDGHTNVHDEARSGRPSVVNDGLVAKPVQNSYRLDRRLNPDILDGASHGQSLRLSLTLYPVIGDFVAKSTCEKHRSEDQRRDAKELADS
ncbi:hypothetical protein AVEN_269537-1 [Araneus ventricosus]|uniref:Mos1 transposase HTH domain-containing protein n=1 Tax=Araneus ventricosus TaxID=182803 RepID=A0A4Y2CD71_ARAVE|nr:hypothetical protein AVEN_269537-1 [Araneus ventricosus]